MLDYYKPMPTDIIRGLFCYYGSRDLYVTIIVVLAHQGVTTKCWKIDVHMYRVSLNVNFESSCALWQMKCTFTF